MIICTEPDDGLTAFERKYLFTEAKGDKKNRKNVRQINIDMTGDKATTTINGNETNNDDVDVDDTVDVDLSELDDEANASDTSIDIETPDDDDPNADMDDEDTDIDLEEPDDVDVSSDEPTEDISTDDGGDDVATEPDDSSGDDSGDNEYDPNSDDSSDDGDGDVAIEPDDDSSSSDDGGDSSGDDSSGDDNSDDSSEESPEDKNDAIHKQALFSKFQNLYEAIGNYNAKLDEIVGKTDTSNHQYKEINDNLKQLSDFLYDYMIIKFKDVSYTESMLFYQRAIGVVNLSLDMLETVRKSEADK